MNTLPHLTQLVERHLTDEQLFSLLESNSTESDSVDDSLRLHLAACAECSSELSTLSDSLTNFRSAATNLASAQMTQRRAVVPARTPGFRRLAWSASFAMAAVLFTVSISLVRPAAGPVTHESAAVVAPLDAATPAAESDDALLDGIQQDLSTSIPPSLEPLAVPSASGSTNPSN